MNKFSKIILIIFGVLIFGFIVFIAIIYSAFNFNDMCGTKLIKTEYSPDKKSKIIIFSQNCGAISDFSTQISIVDVDYKLKENDIGNIFSADSDHHKAKMNGEIIELNTKWKNNDTIEIEYAENSRIFKNEKEMNGIIIMYKQNK
ncbi:DUF5412 family protein [Chryseobacterium oryctis]|uniref:DUF5412 family protein n=1 Tax=Chryseobacterium oryctis TaxID=2952618 RepID=A0ABT3HK36_9FLAO|nr:DUF5412 family protein [Chryseobacterium oryctis]MCW3160158.1 DUF5412 family protein [Chryseobacterium oryctis]